MKFTSVVLFSWIYRVKNSLFTLVPWSPIFTKFPNAVENLLTAGQVHVCQNLCAALNKGVGVGGIVSVKKKSIITLTTWDSLWTFPKCTSIFEVKATIAINRVTILKSKATIALLFDSRATKTKAAIRICQSSWGHLVSCPPPPPHFGAKSHFYGCTVTLPVTSSTAYCRRLSSLIIEASKTSGPGCSNVRELKQRRFWVTRVYRKWGIFPLNMPWW